MRTPREINMLAPLETLFDPDRGIALPLPSELAKLYGRLQFPVHNGLRYVISNFVTTLDGVTTLGDPRHAGGGDISGSNQHDQMVMGLLRAVADAVVIGAGTLRVSPRHLWTAEYIYPALSDAYKDLRRALNKPESPLNVIVTSRGEIDPSLPVFQSQKIPALIVTTADGVSRISERKLSSSVSLVTATNDPRLGAAEILGVVEKACNNPGALVLVEGGPQLMAHFFAERVLDEQFLTLAPQVAGRDDSVRRPGLVDGKILAPEDPVWGRLVGVKRATDHLFLRYAFKKTQSSNPAQT